MITVRLGKHTHEVPTRWAEFTPDGDAPARFLKLCPIFDAFETGAIDFETLRTGVASTLLGADLTMAPKINSILEENICRLASYTEFPFEITENDDNSRTVRLKISLRYNLFPKIGGRPGWRFSVSPAGVVDCGVTAEQYADALQLIDLYSKNRNIDALNALFRVLYGAGTADNIHLLAIYYNFRGVLEFIKSLPDFAMVFARSAEGNSTAANPLGPSASIFTLSKAGYGTLAEIRSLDLLSYLGAIVQLNIDGIHTLRSAGLKPGEIADKMNLPTELVLPYIVDNK